MNNSTTIQNRIPHHGTAMRFFLLFVVMAFVHPLFSQVTWTGATSDDWATATNWDTGTVPAATDNVTGQ